MPVHRLAPPIALLLTLSTGPVAGDDLLDRFLEPVERYTLENGLRVVVRPDPGTGIVAIDTWVEAGYFHEPDEKAGMAHLFEHMFFKGSEKFPGAEEIATALSSVGGATNAGTIYDSTNYYFVVPAEAFARAVEIMADAIANPLFDPEELAREAEVVIEESNRKLDRPDAVSMERMFATAYTQHRMRRWRIGSNEVLRSIRRDDLLAFFRTLYRPENMIVSVAGDVAPDVVRARLEATFGRIPRGTVAKSGGPAEPPQTDLRFGRSAGDLAQGYSVLGWHTVEVGHPDEVALDLLARVLGKGRSSRLYRGAVGPEAAATAEAEHLTFEDIGLLVVQASFDEVRRGEVDRRLLHEIDRLVERGPTHLELETARNGSLSELLLGLESALGQARTLAQFEARGGATGLRDHLAALTAVDVADLQRVASTYLRPDNLTVYHYQPETAAPTTATEVAGLVRDLSPTASEALAEAETPPPPAAVSPAQEAGVQRIALPGGLTLIAEESPGAPVVSAGIFFGGGRVSEHSGNAGITRLMLSTLRRGTSNRSGEEIDREVALYGSSLELVTEPDYFGVAFEAPRTTFPGLLALLADLVASPTFPSDGLEEERHLQLAAIQRAQDSAFIHPLELLAQVSFPGHPYGLPDDGTPASVQRLDREVVREWWKRHVGSRNAVIVVSGDVSTKALEELVKRSFAALPSEAEPAPRATAPPAFGPRRDLIEYRDRRQSAIAIGWSTAPPDHEDWPALRILREVTSGLAGTFFTELRGRRSLAYTVFASDRSNAEAGIFVAYMATDASKESEARDALLTEVRRLGEDGVSESDLERAKSIYAGQTRIRLQTNGARVATLAHDHFFGFGLDYQKVLLDRIAALDLKTVREVAHRYLGGDRFALATVRGQSPEPPGETGEPAPAGS